MPVTSRFSPRVAVAAPAAFLLSLVLTGCDHTATAPRSSPPAQFFQTVSLPDFQGHLVSGPARVAVRLIPGTLTARRVQIEEPGELSQPEEVRSEVTAVSAGTDQGTLTLALGGLQIAFTSATRFRPDDGDEDHSDMALADFVARIQADLAAGRHPVVKARRDPPAQAQAPDDPSFSANELKLDEGNNHPLIRLNVTAANLVTNATPPPDGWLKLLGLSIELRVSDGTTRLAVENPELEGVREFDGMVQSVDQTAGTVTLQDGTIVRIVAGTMFDTKEGDEDDHLPSLTAVQAALTAGQPVKAEGEGLVESTNPLTLDAIKIEFEVAEQERPPQAGVSVEFQDAVAGVDVANSTFTLVGGAVVHVTSGTVIDPEGDLLTLQAVSDALAAHEGVRAEGHATVDALGPPLQLTASDVKFEAH
jgi:hypothetical protein